MRCSEGGKGVLLEPAVEKRRLNSMAKGSWEGTGRRDDQEEDGVLSARLGGEKLLDRRDRAEKEFMRNPS